VFTLVVSRFLRPGSKLKVFEHWQDKLYPVMMAGKDELHHLYRALDLLCQHKEEIENRLYWHRRDLLNMNVDVVLYDLTTLRFESTREDLGELRRFGYSKEMRSDCTQVVLGLLVDTDGIPLAFEVYPGNTFEGNTLVDIVKRMREKFHVRRFIFVADRGLFSAQNLEHIRSQCGSKDKTGEFIVGMKLGQFKKRHHEFYDLTHFELITKGLAVYETTHENDRCIITWSEVRAERDRKTREDILAKINKKLSAASNTGKTFVSNSNYRKYLTGLDKGTPQLNEKAITEEARKDGFFGVITNVTEKQMTAREVIDLYKHLWVVEDAFGEIKGSLKARPIFHWTDDRIVGHLTLCFLAYFCEAKITIQLRQSQVELESPAIDKGVIKKRTLTVVEAMRELAEVRAVPVELKGNIAWVRTDISGNAMKLFRVMGIAIPPKLLAVSQSA
jgi:transposase